MFANSNVTIRVGVYELTDQDVGGMPLEIWESFVEALNKKDANAKMIKKFVDISIWADGENMGLPITELVKPITLKMTLPEKLPTLAEGYVRKYYVVRSHVGDMNSTEPEIEYVVLDAEPLEDGKTLKVTSDKFSLFGIGYSDVEKPVTPPAEDENNTDKGDSTDTPTVTPPTVSEGATGDKIEETLVVNTEKTETPDVPKTGDNVILYVVLAGIAVFGISKVKKLNVSKRKH